MVFFLLIAAVTVTVHADPREWGTQGVPLRQGTYLLWNGSQAPDDAGFTLVVWSDTRTHNSDIYAQLISPTGEALWDSGGISVVAEIHTQRDPVVCATDGGWVVTWIDQRDASHLTLRAQKLNQAGNRLWAAEGSPIDMGEWSLVDIWTKLFLADDNSGGALVVWHGYMSGGQMSILVQRVNAEGASVWPEPLEISDPDGHDLGTSASAADGDGNLYAEFPTYAGDTTTFRCVKITNEGMTPWGTQGVVLDSVVFYGEEYAEQEICADGAGGCYAEWNTGFQHVAANGQMAWLAPVEFGNTHFRTLSALDSAGQPNGCVMITSSNYYYIEQDFYAQKYTADGEALWGPDGYLFYSGLAYDPVAGSDLAGGAVIAWRGEDASGYGISAIRLNSQGASVWPGPHLKAISPSADDASLSLSLNTTECGLFFGNGSGENEFTVAFPQIAQQQLDIASGQPQFPDSGRVLADGITGYPGATALVEMSDQRLAVVWEDGRVYNNVRLMYFQIFDSTGQAQLQDNGEPLLPAVDTTTSPGSEISLASDGAGGFFCLFHDYQNGAWQLRLTRRDEAGVQIGGPHGGLVSVEGYDPSYGYICPDDSGGCYVAWTDRSIWNQNRKYVMRMNAACQPVWTEPLLIIAPYDPNHSLSVTGLVKTSEGGCMVLSQTRVSKVLNGAVAWGQVILNGSAHIEMVADSVGGLFVLWNTANGQDARLQHYDAEGTSWMSTIPFNFEGWHTYVNSMAPAPQNGVYAVLQRYSDDYSQIEVRAQRVTANREILWPDTGILICTQPGSSPRCVATSGNLFAFWEDANGAMVLRGRLIAPDGSVPDPWWQPVEGGLVCDSTDEWSYARIAPLGAHDVGVVFTPWNDGNYSGGDLRAQRLNLETATEAHEPTVLPQEYALYQNYPNPFNPVTRIGFDLPQASKVKLEVFDILGRRVTELVNGRMEAGTHRVDFDATELTSGIYIYRLRAEGFVQSRKMVAIK
jgi:hypothetical protein